MGIYDLPSAAVPTPTALQSQGYVCQADYTFGTGPGCTITDYNKLVQYFNDMRLDGDARYALDRLGNEWQFGVRAVGSDPNEAHNGDGITRELFSDHVALRVVVDNRLDPDSTAFYADAIQTAINNNSGYPNNNDNLIPGTSRPRGYDAGLRSQHITAYRLQMGGYVEICAKMNNQAGAWMGPWFIEGINPNIASDPTQTQLEWPPEIDINEQAINGQATYGDGVTPIWDNAFHVGLRFHPAVGIQGETYQLSSNQWEYQCPTCASYWHANLDTSADFHVYGVKWVLQDGDPNGDYFEFYFDQQLIWKGQFRWVRQNGQRAGAASWMIQAAFGGPWVWNEFGSQSSSAVPNTVPPLEWQVKWFRFFDQSGVVPPPPPPGIIDYSQLRLVFSDEFNTFNHSRGGSTSTWETRYWWGDDATLQGVGGNPAYYLDETVLGVGETPYSIENGALKIHAQHTSTALTNAGLASTYTTGQIGTHSLFTQQYGYFEMRAKVPSIRGTNAAFWMLPLSGPWPPEIDIEEILGRDPFTSYMTNHYNSVTPTTDSGTTADVDLSLAYHTYGLMWTPDTLTFYLDGVAKFTTTTQPDEKAPFYILIGLYIGGDWAGDPVDPVTFQADMYVDYVRVYSTDSAIPLAHLGTVSSPDGVDTTPYGATTADGVLVRPPAPSNFGPTTQLNGSARANELNRAYLLGVQPTAGNCKELVTATNKAVTLFGTAKFDNDSDGDCLNMLASPGDYARVAWDYDPAGTGYSVVMVFKPSTVAPIAWGDIFSIPSDDGPWHVFQYGHDADTQSLWHGHNRWENGEVPGAVGNLAVNGLMTIVVTWAGVGQPSKSFFQGQSAPVTLNYNLGAQDTTVPNHMRVSNSPSLDGNWPGKYYFFAWTDTVWTDAQAQAIADDVHGQLLIETTGSTFAPMGSGTMTAVGASTGSMQSTISGTSTVSAVGQALSGSPGDIVSGTMASSASGSLAATGIALSDGDGTAAIAGTSTFNANGQALAGTGKLSAAGVSAFSGVGSSITHLPPAIISGALAADGVGDFIGIGSTTNPKLGRSFDLIAEDRRVLPLTVNLGLV